ncbi:MAG TPA: glutamine--tRNA ligase/YqeY domain fusion protein [Deltaproteobacteria bacterium]|nr:glutamine--tRNA ligase/YqeY domain fusion protein [Deltaproteobacteria bacterium]
MDQTNSSRPSDFIRDIIDDDFKTNKHQGRVAVRFPPEPNGYLHIGHAKSVCLNFGIAAQYGGTCNLRMDDTDPSGESMEYVESIIRDIQWLGFDWGDRLFFASDYYERLYEYAVQMIKEGKAFVCDLDVDEMREHRGSFTEPGRESPYRNRPVEENLDLFERMRAGEFEEGTHTLRAKIDMASPNITMRDPIMYRIKKEAHYRTGNKWCIYPMYDFTHCLSDSLERITHSICTLEFENNRPLYDWFLEAVNADYRPQQIEFARLNLTYTIMSKRLLIELVSKGIVKGWNDPLMPTITGMRRRGYTPAAIRDFCDRIGVAKNDSMIDMALLENCVRDDLNQTTPRVMAVLRPLKVIIDNYPDDQVEEFDCPFHPQNPDMGSRKVPFSKVLYIERDDFMEDPPKKFFRMAIGREVRLRYGYFVTCVDVVKDRDTGEVVELHCTYDPETRSGFAPDGRKVKATIHWVSAAHSIPAEVRLYDRLFQVADPLEDDFDYMKHLNPNSLEVLTSCRVDPSLANAEPESRYQFERLGYFCVDSVDSSAANLVFNRTVTLRDSWVKIARKGEK